MGNQVLSSNPPNADYHLSTNGSNWLWAVFSLFAVSLFAITAWTLVTPRGTRLFHHIAIVVITTGAIAYFSMASDLGATPILVEFRGTGTRQIWYVRYIQWFITFPLLLLELLLASGLSLSDMFTAIFMAITLVIMGLVGALVSSTYKWGFYAFGIFALSYIWYTLLWHGPRTTVAVGGTIRSSHRLSSFYLSFLLLLYPIAWGCSEGGNVISVTAEMIWYGILDILAGPVFLFFFLFKLRGVDHAMLNTHSAKYAHNNVGVVPTTAQRGDVVPVTTMGSSTGPVGSGAVNAPVVVEPRLLCMQASLRPS